MWVYHFGKKLTPLISVVAQPSSTTLSHRRKQLQTNLNMRGDQKNKINTHSSPYSVNWKIQWGKNAYLFSRDPPCVIAQHFFSLKSTISTVEHNVVERQYWSEWAMSGTAKHSICTITCLNSYILPIVRHINIQKNANSKRALDREQ